MAAFFGADDIWSRREEGGEKERVLAVGVWETSGDGYASEEDFLHSLDELTELAEACMMHPVGIVTQQLPKVNAALYVGTGKAEEIRENAEAMEASRIVFNDTLSPSQMRNLQKTLNLPVMDRTGLILEIFERRARSREAKLQVELAKLRYLKPRLIGMWETQNRQGGASGSMSSKGEGETQLEIDRRTIDHRLSELSKELKVVSRERETQRKKRQHSGLPLVALVGYTNAGKSTIMNAMINRYVPDTAGEDRKVFEADMLFATLDTTVRKIEVERGRHFLLSDTVGFIHKLPTALVEAFKSTLEEVKEADLLLQVVDGSDPHCRDHIEVTKQTIADLGAGHIPMITVFNKSDRVEPAIEYPRRGLKESSVAGDRNENIYISAREASSIELLTEVILGKLESGAVVRDFLIPYDKGAVHSYLMENAIVEMADYTAEGILVRAKCDVAVADKAEKMIGLS
ncbi:MAG: GTPase HflX [Lachnospiraceae bacterium]|nr:GTPase HflX [Lachnospiraceae bacterium]